MIDFDKLKIVCDLCNEINSRQDTFVNLNLEWDVSGALVRIGFRVNGMTPYHWDDCIDSLIEKLTRIATPKIAKWILNQEFEIEKVMLNKSDAYDLEKARQVVNSEAPSRIYNSKKELIEAQIKYWDCLRCQLILDGGE